MTTTTTTSNQAIIKAAVRSLYAIQKLRIQQGNRIVAAFRVKLGLTPSAAEDTSDEASELLNSLRDEYARITDGVKTLTRRIKIPDGGSITNFAELTLIEGYERTLLAESIHERVILDALEREPIWEMWLKDVRGVGPLMAGVLISEIDIHKARYPSSLWKLAGLDVAPNEAGVMEGRSRKRYHLEEKEYIDRDGNIQKKIGITFNPFLKTKTVGVLADVFIKLGGPYKKIYENYKHRLENHPKWRDEYIVVSHDGEVLERFTDEGEAERFCKELNNRIGGKLTGSRQSSKGVDASAPVPELYQIRKTGRSKGHRHAAAKRYAVKIFLMDLHREWRGLEGYPPTLTYQEAKLGHKHAA